MCIILVCPPGRTPDFDNIVQATYENEDGSGWMIRAPHGIEIVRSARNIEHVISTFTEARAMWPDSWAVWHSRLATHGQIDDANTHPFVIPGTNWAMVHNGILPLSDGPFRHDRSDSRILAEDHLSAATWREMREHKATIETWLQGDKVVVMSGSKEKGGPVIIFNEKRGEWDPVDNCWYSHPLYWPKYSRAAVGKYLDEDEYDWEKEDMPAIPELTTRTEHSLTDAELQEIYDGVFDDSQSVMSRRPPVDDWEGF